MTTRAPPGKTPQPRHVYGPRAIGAVLPSVTRPIFRSHGAALGQLLLDWPGIIGPQLAAVTTPRRLAAGTLTLGCTGPVALELQHLAGPLMERVNTHLGRAAVQRLRFVQEAAAARTTARPVAPPGSRSREPVVIEGVPDGPLRDALAALGAAVRSERA